MGDPPLDDTKPPAPPRQRKPGAYYYDDQTGYEPYDPSLDEEEDANEARDEKKPTGQSD